MTLVRAVVLAAGRSSRMGRHNKLLARFDGVPLIRRTVMRALASRANGVLVVTGHQAGEIAQALAGLDAAMVHNADFASGLAGSLKTAVSALPGDASGALVVLGDMPAVETEALDRMIDVFERRGGGVVVRATHGGKPGNPVLLPRELFAAVGGIEGDVGARHLVAKGLVPVVDVEIGAGAGIDVDTPQALESAGGVLQD